MRFNSAQIQKIGKEIRGKVDGKTLFDEFSRGRYSTDASVYQIKPLGVVLPKDTNDVLSLMEYSQKNSINIKYVTFFKKKKNYSTYKAKWCNWKCR